MATPSHSPRLVLVRHGETEWSRTLRHTGRTDVPLTEEGRRTAARLRAPLAEYAFGRVLASPMQRAVDTCSLAGLGERAEREERLLEWDYGDYEGITTQQIREERPGWFLWRDGCPGGEEAGAVGARVDSLLDSLAGEEGDVALFAHGHVLRVVAARWVGLGPEGGALLALSTAAVCVLGWERETRVLWLWNATPAAEAGGP